MAARQDQTLQIALIFFVGLAVILGGCLVWVNRLKADYRQQVESLEQDKADESNKARTLQNENEQYRLAMGFGQFDNLDTVSSRIATDLETYGASFDESSRSYRAILEALNDENRISAQQESESKIREKQLKERLLAVESEKEAQIKEFQQTLQKVEADAASERNKFNTARADLQTQQESLKQSLARQRAAQEKLEQELNTKVARVQSELDDAVRSRIKLLEDRKQEATSFEVADGRVTWVNQANQTVWINLGKDDSLRRQVTFSVFEQDAADAGKAAKKGSIEVVRLLGDNMAEAEITNDNPRNPILPGDQIYSQVWHRGKKVHFAFAGTIDFDGDKRSDLQRARDLIALNGGVVDAYADDEGNVQGELSVETRYLVTGDYPGGVSDGKQKQAWDQMSKRAQALGIESITLNEFLNRMGYKPQTNTVQLTGGGVQSTGSGSGFRPRSAYFTN